MKRHALIPLLLIFLGLSGQAAALPIISLVPDNNKIHAGENLFVDVNVSGLQSGGSNSLLGAFSMDVLFNPQLQILPADSGVYTWGFGLGDVDAGEAVVGGDISQIGSGRFSFYEVSLLDSIELSALQSDSFRLATLAFYLPYGHSLASGSINFSTANVVLSDDLGNELITGVNQGATVRVPEPPIALLFIIGILPFLFNKKFSYTSGSIKSIKKMYARKSAVLVGILTAIGIGTVNAAPTWTPFVPIGSISPLGPGMLPASDYMSGASDDMYTWYCDLSVNYCPPQSTYSRAHFRQTFTLPQQGYPLYTWGSISIAADDYFALYINNRLVGESWLDDKSTATFFDNIADYMVLGQENVIDIFVCDGDKGNSSAGPTPDEGFHACTNAISRVNHWLLVSGQLQVEDNTPGGDILKTVSFRSGEPSDWQARALIADPLSSEVNLPSVCQSHKDIIGNPVCTLGELISNPSASIDIDGTKFIGFFQQPFNFSTQELQSILVDPVLEKVGTRSLVGLRFTPTDGLASLLENYSSEDYLVDKYFAYDVSVENGETIYASNLSLSINDWVFRGGILLQGGVRSTLEWPGQDVFMNANCSPKESESSCHAFKNSTFDSTNELFVSNNLFIQHEQFTSGDDGMRLTKLSQTYIRAPINASPSDLVDLNADGCVDRTDVDLVMTQLRNPDASLLYDMNGDGKVNVADSRKLVTLFTNPRGAACN